MSQFHLVRQDAVTLLRDLEDESIDLSVLDPAYESLERHRKKGTTTRLAKSKASSNDWFKIFPNNRAPDLFHELYRVMKKRSHVYILCDDPTDEVYRVYARNAGFWVWKSVVWVKTKTDEDDPEELTEADPKAGMGYHWRNCLEHILFLEKRSTIQVDHPGWSVRKDPTGKGLQLNNKGWPDCLPCRPVHNGYPTEKPVPLLEKLILNSSQPGDVVLDPFMGSGSTGEAALLNQRCFLGGDVGVESMVVTHERLIEIGEVF